MIKEDQIACPDCKTFIREVNYKIHVRNCQKYIGIALKQIRRLPKLTLSQTKLLIAEMDVCREILQQKLFQNIEDEEIPDAYWPKKNSSDDKNRMIEQPLYLNQQSNQYNETEIVSCCKCNKKFYASYDANSLFYVYECWHLYCIPCMRQYIEQQFISNGGDMKCLSQGCENKINQQQIRNLIGRQKFQALQYKVIRKMMNIIECVKCHSQYGFAPGNPRDAPPKDNNGKALTETDRKHYAQNRFVCPKADCKTQQCKQCKAVPFHIAMTCKDFKSRLAMKKCRYCDEPLTQKNKPKNIQFQALDDICNNKQCQTLAANACTKILVCGHPCNGCRGEIKCLPCLNQKCSKQNEQLNGQSGNDYCNICFVQALNASPCVRSQCGHIFHEKCLRKRYEIRWLTPRILFNFCMCPLCKKWVNLPVDSKLTPMIKKNIDLHEKIQKMSAERLKFQSCEKDQKIVNPASPYYKKPVQYAMAIYAYFQCFKCKNPYFGGRKNCADAMNEAQNAGSFKAEQLICPNCCEIPIQNCPKHGKDFIEFKCKFCCSTAQWFCWGNTHFCEPCHKKQCNGDYVSQYSKDKLPKCQGQGKCPIGGNHNGNGEQRTLGCAICRNYKANNKDF